MMKEFFWAVEDLHWNMKCRYIFWLHGPYGLANVIQKLPNKFIVKYLKKYGATIGNKCLIESGIIIHRPDSKIPFKNMIFSDNIYIGHNCIFDLSEKIQLSNNIAIGAACQFWTHTGDFLNDLKAKGDYNEKIQEIKINDNVIIYSNVIINQGVNIGENCRIGASSVVLNNLMDNSFYAGIPAKKIKERELIIIKKNTVFHL